MYQQEEHSSSYDTSNQQQNGFIPMESPSTHTKKKGTLYQYSSSDVAQIDKDTEVLMKAQSKQLEAEADLEPIDLFLQVEISVWRFMTVVLLSVLGVVAIMAVFYHGVTLEKGITDPIGSTVNADDVVEYYQTISGYLLATIGEAMGRSFNIFLAVMGTYFANIKWYPSDDPSTHTVSRIKTLVMLAFTPAVMYVLNVGLTSLNIQHTTVGVEHIFIRSDLITTELLVNLNLTNATNWPVEKTVLRGAVLRRVEPFQINSDSSCLSRNNNDSMASDSVEKQTTLPTVRDIRSTSIVYGFPLQNWNQAVLPTALTPTYSVSFTYGQLESELEEVEANFTAFQEASNFAIFDGYEMYLQGKTLLERSISDSNASAEYACTLVDGRSDDDLTAAQLADPSTWDNTTFAYFTDGENAGKRICKGAISSLPDLANISDPQTHTLEEFAETMIWGINKTLAALSISESKLTLETYHISPLINLTAITIDIPMASDVMYRNLQEFCNSDGTLRDDFIAAQGNAFTEDEMQVATSLLCSQAYYPYEDPASTCGATNCVFLDKSGSLSLKKQLQLLPYNTDCSVQDLTYNSDFHNFLPKNCQSQSNSVFLYGLATYMGGDLFSDGTDMDDMPYLLNTRRHIVISFAKLDWQFYDVSKSFGAICGIASGCDGLVHQLTNLTHPTSLETQILVASSNTLPADRFSANFTTPVQLVTLHAQPFYYPSDERYYEWEYLNPKHFTQANWSMGLSGDDNCNVLIDAYIHQVEANHYYLDDPLQAMYTSALYYLFQNAAVKDAILPIEFPKDKIPGLYFGTNTRFKGDREEKVVEFSIPLVSAISTFAGISLLLIISLLILLAPQERVKNSDAPNTASQYAKVLIKDEYPPAVHARRLLYASGESVEMDEYTVESITFHRKHDKQSKILL